MRKRYCIASRSPKRGKTHPRSSFKFLFLLLFLSLVPNITYKRSAQCRIQPIADHPPQPSLFEGKGAWLLYRFSQGLERSMEQVRSPKAGPSEERKRVMVGKRAERERRVMGREKRESFIFSPLPITPFVPFP